VAETGSVGRSGSGRLATVLTSDDSNLRRAVTESYEERTRSVRARVESIRGADAIIMSPGRSERPASAAAAASRIFRRRLFISVRQHVSFSRQSPPGALMLRHCSCRTRARSGVAWWCSGYGAGLATQRSRGFDSRPFRFQVVHI